MAGIYAVSHGLEGVAFLLAAAFLYWRLSERDHAIRLTRLTMHVLALLGVFFIGIYISEGFLAGTAAAALTGVIHLAMYLAVGEMWKIVTVFLYTDYEKYHRIFQALAGISVLLGLGVYTGMLPPAVIRALPIGLVPIGIVMAGFGYYTAYQLGGADAEKISIFSTAILDALVGSALLNNMYLAGVIQNPYYPIANNLVYGALFLLAVFWGELRGVKW